ncbi:MAG: hypothetical protein AAB576_00695 [Elusimicrobiota bacterium]
MAKTIKTAVSLPLATYRRAESLRHKAKMSRSAVYAAALQSYFESLEVRELEARYAAGYRAKPEDIRDIEASTKAGAALFAKEDW